MPIKQDIINEAIEFILSNPQGVRYSELKSELEQEYPKSKSIKHYIWNLDKTHPDEIYKPARGLFRHISSKDNLFAESETQPIVSTEEPSRIDEKDFYQPFADWLQNDIQEVTKVIPLGGKKFQIKWGTPDVIGVYKTGNLDIVKQEPTIVSAEIKMSSSGNELITGFGQACAYKLFSHKVYFVIPNCAIKEDIDRVEALCLILGFGLILFDNKNLKTKWEIKCRASKHEPDIWYVNDTMRKVPELFK
jgi:hypothetical protein